MKLTGVELIKKRRESIEKERARFKKELERLDAEQVRLAKEEEELAIAQRVLDRLANPDAEDEAEAEAEAKSTNLVIPKNGTKRPNGIPTMRVMIDKILWDAEKRGKDGLMGRDLVIEVNDRWWPGVGWNDVLPTALRLVRKEQLGRSEGRFIRVNDYSGQNPLPLKRSGQSG